MICNNCINKKICKNYDYLLEHNELTISNCERKISELIINKKEEDFKPKYGGFIPPKDNIAQFPMKSKEEIKSELVIINCPTCGKETLNDDVKECIKCGKLTCSNCGIDIVNCEIKDNEESKEERICNECYGYKEGKEIFNSNLSFKDILNNSINGDDE